MQAPNTLSGYTESEIVMARAKASTHLDAVGTTGCKVTTQTMQPEPEDQTSDSEITTMGALAQEVRRSEFTRPSYSFKGVELWPYTYGYELLFNQVRDPEDTGLFTWLAFIYLLWRHDPDEDSHTHRNWAVSNCWKVNDFRRNLTIWMDVHGPFTTEDKLEARRIYEESMKAVNETSVEPVKSISSPQKKTARKGRR